MKSKYEQGLIRDGEPVQTWREPSVSGSSRVRRGRALCLPSFRGEKSTSVWFDMIKAGGGR